jgi:DNA-binding GntR family transcriptional regulator
MLELDSLRRAVRKHTGSSIRKLRFMHTQLELAEETHQWAHGDREFHELLYAPCGRARTLEIIKTLRDAVQRFYLAEMRHSDHRQGWKRDPQRIIRAVEGSDIEAACAALGTHLRETERVVKTRLRQLENREILRDVKASG